MVEGGEGGARAKPGGVLYRLHMGARSVLWNGAGGLHGWTAVFGSVEYSKGVKSKG